MPAKIGFHLHVLDCYVLCVPACPVRIISLKWERIGYILAFGVGRSYRISFCPIFQDLFFAQFQYLYIFLSFPNIGMRRLPNMFSVKFTSFGNIPCFSCFPILSWKKKKQGEKKKSCSIRTAEKKTFQSFEILQTPKYLEGFAFQYFEKKNGKYGNYLNVRAK